MATDIFPFEVWPEGILQARLPANDNSLRSEVLNKSALTIADSEPSPSNDGDVHIVGVAWGGFDSNDVVIRKAGSWYAFAPYDGWTKYLESESKLYIFTGSWGELSPGGGMSNPMTSAGDVIVGGVSGAPTRLAATTNGYVLTLAAGAPVWAASSGGGFANPMTTLGDLIVGGASGAAGRVGVGTDGQVLTVVGGVPAWGASGGGGLTGFTGTIFSAAPNVLSNVAQLAVSVTTSVGGMVLSPKGAGALMMNVPDNTAAGGNIRGSNAIDLQRQRGAASQVASGGSSIAIGASNTASGMSCTAIGDSHVVSTSSYGGAFGGYLNTVSGYASVTVGGRGNSLSGNRSIALSGQALSDRGISGLALFGSAGQTNNVTGKRQGELYAWAGSTSNATTISLGTDGAAAGSANQAVLGNNSVMCIRGQVTARHSAGDVKCWAFDAAAKRVANAASTVLIGVPTVTVVGEDIGASAWVFDVSVDASNGAISLRATGEAGKTIAWTASAISSYTET